ncbi:sporulation-specific N-acetylmuramoyl-L-alanine amidase [Virgibacillus kimchii]
MKLYLDPGHGGNDSGATGNGLMEKNVVLDISLKIRNLLNDYEGISVKMSRTNDKSVSLLARTNEANNWGADYFLSVHANAFNGSANGYEDFIHNSLGSNSQTAKLRDTIHAEIMKQVDFNNRGKKSANFHVLRETSMSAILTENGFIDHAGDAAKLKSDAYLNRIAQGHVNGLAKAFNLKKKSSGGGNLHLVQIGAFSDKSNADSLVKQAHSKDFDAYVKQEGGLFKVQIGAFANRKNAEDHATVAKRAGFDVYITE